MDHKILCVDDEPNILESFRRNLGGHFSLETAIGGDAALKKVSDAGPFAVIISDLKMPGMDGIQLLAKMREITQDSVRIMLTGHADLEVAMEAVNEGNIFRFLKKPCPPQALIKACHDGIEQYRLVTAEKELLEKTLRGSITVLAEVLSLVNPAAFGKSLRLQRIMRRLAITLNYRPIWEFDIAGLLSQIGCVSLTNEVLEKKYRGEKLTPAEVQMYARHPGMAGDLIRNIPRLEKIARIISLQEEHGAAEASNEGVPIGARALHVAIDFDAMITGGASPAAALEKMRRCCGCYDPSVLEALEKNIPKQDRYQTQPIDIDDLRPGMVLAEDVRSCSGLMLIAKGQTASPPLIARLRNFNRSMGVQEPIQVLVKKT